MSETTTRVGRRRVQGAAIGLAGIAILLLVGGAAGIEFLRQPDLRPHLGNINDLTVGAARLYRPQPPRSVVDAPVLIHPIYVARISQTEALGFAYRDPRNGCPLVWQPQPSSFVDVCHGSTYKITGEYLRGPSRRDLDQFPLQIDHDGTIIVAGGVKRGTALR
jgi:hypothetical protein